MRLSPGRFLARVTALPAIAVSAWLLVTFPLLALGAFTPLLSAIFGVPAVVAACVVVPRLIPEPEEDRAPWWPVVLVLLIVVVFAAVQIAYHAEALVIRRDPASYAMYTVWIAENGSLPIPRMHELIAGNDPALSYQSLAHYERGDVIWPQFMAGAPLLTSIGYWLGGLTGMLVTTPVLGALGVLVFAGLAARLIGVRWAPLAALVLAVCLPQQWVSRFTYSEPVTQILLLGGLVLAFDALARHSGPKERWGRAHTLAAASGLVFGLALVTRIDVIRDLLPIVGFLGVLLLARRGQAVPMLGGLAVGVAMGLYAGYGLSYPYLEYLSDSLVPLLIISAVVIAVTVVAIAALWKMGLPRVWRVRWLPNAVAIAAVVLVVGLALRPLLWPDYGHGSDFTDQWVAAVQEMEGISPIEGSRTYYDYSLYWVGWYVGLGSVLFATFGVALVLRKLAQGRLAQWLLPTMLLSWTVVTTLLRPAITPDHPWASRRLIVLVIPAFVLFAVWFTAWLTRCCARASRPGHLVVVRSLPTVVAAGASVAMIGPTLITSTQGIMGYRQDVGTVAATENLCESLPEDGSVIVVDSGMASNYMPLFRNVCGLPTAAMNEPTPEDVDRVVDAVHDRDRTAVLAGPDWRVLDELTGVEPERPFRVVADMDPSTLMRPPTGSWAFDGSVWVSVVPPEENTR